MANVQVSVKCTGCEFTSRIMIKPPGLFQNRISMFDCPCCKSEILARISKATGKGVKPGIVNIGTKITRPSPMLLEMWKQEAEERAAR
jgi:hypothetical protein